MMPGGGSSNAHYGDGTSYANQTLYNSQGQPYATTDANGNVTWTHPENAPLSVQGFGGSAQGGPGQYGSYGGGQYGTGGIYGSTTNDGGIYQGGDAFGMNSGGSSDINFNGSGSGGFDWTKLLPLLGSLISAYGAYKSSAANQSAAASGPVLPKDVQASRLALGDKFLAMILTPGGTTFGAPPFDLSIGEGKDPFAAVNNYRTASQPLFQNDLNTALNTEKAKLGGQYGIRFGTDLQRGLSDTALQATNSREATLGGLGVNAYDTYMQRQLALLGTRLQDYRAQQVGFLPLIANYLSGQPSSSPYQGGSPAGQALQALGGAASNYPLYQYLANQNNG